VLVASSLVGNFRANNFNRAPALAPAPAPHLPRPRPRPLPRPPPLPPQLAAAAAALVPLRSTASAVAKDSLALPDGEYYKTNALLVLNAWLNIIIVFRHSSAQSLTVSLL
jgi:hypothetical protein